MSEAIPLEAARLAASSPLVAGDPPMADPAFTPAGLQRRRTLTVRRFIVAALNLASLGAIAWIFATALGAGGWSTTDIILYACFLIGSPWMVMGVWNAVIGLWVLHGPRGVADAAPVLEAPDPSAPVRVRVAIAMCLRNEPPARALNRLAAIRQSLDATGQGAQFEMFALSDTDDPALAAEESRLFDEMRPIFGPGARYRRREVNEAWKAGNIRDFLRRWGKDYDLFLPLDTDSLMSGETIVRMTRVMQAHPRIGILQSLVVGAPSDSFFARVFQFGMRHGMRSYTAGAVWWHGDASAYWGHNALIRTKPFRLKCRLPDMPGEPPLGGPILSHDQVEAALMRRAGYEVRVLPVETESYEDNPPTILDFIKRDHRWCNGNMQYFPLLGIKGLVPASRFQIFSAIMMYFGAPAWMLMTLTASSKLFAPEPGGVDVAFGMAMFFIMFSVSLAPKIAGWIDVALTKGGAARYGGRLRFALGAFVETVFSMLIAPVTAFAVTWFMIGLLFGKRISWSGQQRDLTRVSWAQAVRAFWPQTVLGLGMFVSLWIKAPGALAWAIPMVAGLGLAIPFAVLTANPWLGRWSQRVGLCAIPEEFDRTPILRELDAVAERRAPRRAA